MEYPVPLVEGTIIKRYKRFLVDVELPSGEIITAHLANTGSMKTCWEPGWKCLLSFHDNPKRKLKYGLEMTSNGKTWIGVNTHLPNKIVLEAIKNGEIKELTGYDYIKPEYKVGNSRIDIFMSRGDKSCFVEIKNVTLLGDNKTALFPDAKTERGQKHLRELTRLIKEGHRGVMFYLVQREDVDLFMPAAEIDPEYASLLEKGHKAGLEILVYQCRVGKDGISIKKALPFKLPS
ncbi:MAG: DNA/RNA nuclease SfsA [Deltaproteobacteria bacterium]|nr:MAG: DNA/RNA nuclease SfsA [Deltaproteobacteria bacterium]